MGKWTEKFAEKLLLTCALSAIVAIILIVLFVFWEGYPVLHKTGLIPFLFRNQWLPAQEIFGVYPMIIGSLAVTLGALGLGVPLALAAAIFMAELAPQAAVKILRPAIELLAGIPSVIYGLFGMTVVVPVIRYLSLRWLGPGAETHLQLGYSVLAASIILAIMILPTIINIAEGAIRAVPAEYREGSFALGATQWQTITRAVLPTARSGIIAGIALGMGRAIGETMAVIMVAGNTILIPSSIFAPVRTLTANIAIESAYATGMHEQALFANGIVLFVFIFTLTFFSWLATRWGGQHI